MGFYWAILGAGLIGLQGFGLQSLKGFRGGGVSCFCFDAWGSDASGCSGDLYGFCRMSRV